MSHDNNRSKNLLNTINSATGYSSDKILAEYFGTSRSTIWLWSKTGHLPKPIKLSEGCTRWCNKAIKQFEKEAAS